MKNKLISDRHILINGKNYVRAYVPHNTLLVAEDDLIVDEAIDIGFVAFLKKNDISSKKNTYLMKLLDLDKIIAKNDSVDVDNRDWHSRYFKYFHPKRNFIVRLNEYPNGQGGIKFYLGNLGDKLKEEQLTSCIFYINELLKNSGANLSIDTVFDKNSKRHGEFAFKTDPLTFEQDKLKLITILNDLNYLNDEGGFPNFDKRQ